MHIHATRRGGLLRHRLRQQETPRDHHPPPTSALGPLAAALAALAATVWCQRRAQQAQWEQVRTQALRYGLAQFDALTHRDFESAVRDLMRRDGCPDAVQVGGQGDLGADEKATDPYGRLWVLQCKHRRSGDRGAVGTPDLQVLNGTARPVHRADVVVLVTNGRITQPGRDFAQQQRLHLVDAACSPSGPPAHGHCGNCCARYPRRAARPPWPDPLLQQDPATVRRDRR